MPGEAPVEATGGGLRGLHRPAAATLGAAQGHPAGLGFLTERRVLGALAALVAQTALVDHHCAARWPRFRGLGRHGPDAPRLRGQGHGRRPPRGRRRRCRGAPLGVTGLARVSSSAGRPSSDGQG